MPSSQHTRPATRDRDQIQAGPNWLLSFHWSWYVTMTFAIPMTRARAERAAVAWVEDLGELARSAYAYVATERGEAGELIHLHSLIGGNRNELAMKVGAKTWEKRHGEIHWDRFRPGGGACRYLMKHVDKNGIGRMIGRPEKVRRCDRVTVE